MKKIPPYLILAIIICFHLAATFAWLMMDKSYLKLDAWRNFRYSIEVSSFFKEIWHLKFSYSYLEPQTWHGVLVEFLTAPFLLFFGPNQDMAIMINSTVFLPILILSIYGIAKKISGAQAGILAAFILSSYPIIFNHLRLYMLDLPLTSIVSASIYFLISSEDFKNKRYSLLFWLSFALGLLIKFNYLIFIIGPLALTAYNRNISLKKRLFKKAAPGAPAFILALVFLLCIIFYRTKMGDILQRAYSISILGHLNVSKINPGGFFIWKLKSILSFIELFVSQGISFLMLIPFLITFAVTQKYGIKYKRELYLALSIPLFLLLILSSVSPDCALRYAMPIFPVLAIITASGISKIKNKAGKRNLIFSLVLLGLTQFFAASYGLPFLPQKISFTIPGKLYNFNLVLFQQKIEVTPFLEDKNSHPTAADWKSTDTLKAILESNPEGKRIKVISLNYVPELFEAIDYQILINRKLIDFVPINTLFLEEFHEKRPLAPDQLCLSADYIIVSNNINSPWEKFLNSSAGWRDKVKKARVVFYQNISHFNLIKTLPLPDNTELYIYKNIYNKEAAELYTIKSKDIKLLFDSGRIRIFYKEREITKGLGLYASLLSLQHWRDSMEAGWKVSKDSDKKITARGRWMFIPIVQTWTLELKENNIYWAVETSSQDPIKIEAEDFKLMLTDKYKEWYVSDGTQGAFPGNFAEYVWQKIWAGSNANYMGVKAVKTGDYYLPAVKFSARSMPPSYHLSIENSDRLFYGRVIGSFKKNTHSDNLFSASKTEYFSAEISIEPL